MWFSYDVAHLTVVTVNPTPFCHLSVLDIRVTQWLGHSPYKHLVASLCLGFSSKDETLNQGSLSI